MKKSSAKKMPETTKNIDSNSLKKDSCNGLVETKMKRTTLFVISVWLLLFCLVVYVAFFREDRDEVSASPLAASSVIRRRDEMCRMTWMFPSYVPVNLSSFLSSFDDKRRSLIEETPYRLYFYREEGSKRRSLSSLRGIPVLFFHGSAGSYKQIRSIASELSKVAVIFFF